ncbi:MAG: tRNA 2-thiouridine(34) synthase MnmA [Deltaproteobacteria bacterium]|nr:tRNA 2-thiouridine(34) synthase MnmA [Deltaproteobacteria bacterium]
MQQETSTDQRTIPDRGRVALAMSGGVDSSIAAALLLEQGWDVVGLHMKLHNLPDEQRRDRSCCSVDDSLDARSVCARLGIPFYVLDFTQSFHEEVVRYFADSYRQGLTPNPCVMCNRTIKNRLLLEKAREFGCTRLATGHYARIGRDESSGAWQLLRASDSRKDQTYFLFATAAGELPSLLFPLGELEKTEARDLARRRGLTTWDKPDSQEVCFITGDYRDFLAGHYGSGAPLPGDFVDSAGAVLGRHRGLAYYTVGQRRGLGVSGPRPYYVVGLRPLENQVVLGDEAELFSTGMEVAGVNWVSIPPPAGTLRALVKVRYSHAGAWATITPGEAGHVQVEFEAPVKAVTPGQAAVFYDGPVVLGGGWITPGQGGLS